MSKPVTSSGLSPDSLLCSDHARSPRPIEPPMRPSPTIVICCISAGPFAENCGSPDGVDPIRCTHRRLFLAPILLVRLRFETSSSFGPDQGCPVQGRQTLRFRRDIAVAERG